MNAEFLAQRVVELIESAVLPPLEAGSVLGLLAVVLAGAGLVTVKDFALGGRERLPLLVAEPFPRVDASVSVVLATSPTVDLTALRRHAQHPAVDAVVVVASGPDVPLLPRHLDGVPVRAAVLHAPPAAATDPAI